MDKAKKHLPPTKIDIDREFPPIEIGNEISEEQQRQNAELHRYLYEKKHRNDGWVDFMIRRSKWMKKHHPDPESLKGAKFTIKERKIER